MTISDWSKVTRPIPVPNEWTKPLWDAATQGVLALLDDLLERSVRTEFIYRHKWRKGDMLIWDNRAAMHRAFFDYDPDQYRLLYRVIVRGELPF